MNLRRCKYCNGLWVNSYLISSGRKWVGIVECDNWRCRKLCIERKAHSQEKALHKAEIAWNQVNDPSVHRKKGFVFLSQSVKVFLNK